MDWPFKRKPAPSKTPTAILHKKYGENGVVFPCSGGLDSPSDERVALLGQLAEEGFAEWIERDLLLPWESLYQLITSETYRDSLQLLGLPFLEAWRPVLKSRNGLTDADFSILLDGWITPDDMPFHGNSSITGAVIKAGSKEILLPEAAWRTTCALALFHRRSNKERSPDSNRRFWAIIRRHAVEAGADLADFLRKTVVLVPERLRIGLHKAQFGESKTVEVIPGFDGEPERWLEIFDRLNEVPDRYDIPDGQGMVHVLLTPEARTVLGEIKRMPGRRVSGARAEAFLHNPFAALGPEATKVLDPEQIEKAKEDAGISYASFTAKIERDAGGFPVACSLKIEEFVAGDIHSGTLPLDGEEAIEKFIAKLKQKIAQGAQCCFWEGYDLEILGDTPAQLEILESALLDLRKKRWFSAAEIFDLSRYAQGKIEGIGEEKPYYSVFIARKDDDSGWFPENIVCGFSFVPEGETEVVYFPLNDEGLKKFKREFENAKVEGKNSFDLPGCPKPIPLVEAEKMLSILGSAGKNPQGAVEAGIKQGRQPRKGLILKQNISQVNYEERRGLLAVPAGMQASLPKALKDGINIKGHQLAGVAWLQHLWSLSPDECRGALLADDMGLGKTLQMLTFVASILEKNPETDPFLIVAPVSLLENWREEMAKFFIPGTFPLLTLYGDDLARLRAPKDIMDEELSGIRLLQRNWLGNARVVLTTYETLRDLEFTLAAQKWSAVICDEAQKIKNPNAMVTTAAKKQNVRFKIACTGTPVENTLADLWCLFDFIQPGLLRELNEFGRNYRKPIEAETVEQKQRVEELRSLIEPQLLRRTKADVIKDLPRKVFAESCKKLPLSERQRSLYFQVIGQHRKQSAENAGQRTHLGLLQYLRKLCADAQPIGQIANFSMPLSEIEIHSPKIKWLMGELKRISDLKEKVILFCELRDVQRLLQKAVSERFGFVPAIINGDTSTNCKSEINRQKLIGSFQEKPGFGVIILSPLAAGVGLNIQAANHVVHFTRTWNPAKEDQATDRAYRIGQTRDVFVYCPLVVADDFTTFDVKLDALLERKRELSGDMLNGVGDLSISDFADIEDPGGMAAFPDKPITIEDVALMASDTFEKFCVALWGKQGYKAYLSAGAGDGGVDVVAIKDATGLLIQCKTSYIPGKSLGWDAVRDVVAGAAAYENRYRGVNFRKLAVTNQHFNGAAKEQAILNSVELVDRDKIDEMLRKYPVDRSFL